MCKAELPAFAQASSGYGSRVAFVGVDTYDASPNAALALARASKVRYPLMNDTAAQRMRAAYGVGNGLPVTFVIDRTGRVRWEVLGQVTKATLASELAPLLARGAG